MGSFWRRLKSNHFLLSVARWFDDEAGRPELTSANPDRVDWLRILPFLALHVLCLGPLWVGWSWAAIGVAIGMFAIRMFAITGGYHRYFSHRTYRTSRAMQFALAVLGSMAAQRGPLWWASHHRRHHRCADTPEDVHSPLQHGFLWSHVLWLTTPRNFVTEVDRVRDWAKYPELRFLNRFSIITPALTAAALYGLGEALGVLAPASGANGVQMAVWGFVISTVVLYHATFTINSLDHMVGRRRYETPDGSRNNWILALLTFGEGWHNNHHRYPGSTRQGFYWWELDLTYYILRVLSWLGLVRGLRTVPYRILEEGRDRPEAGRDGR